MDSELINQNLFNFYRALEASEEIEYINKPSYESIVNHHGEWPSFTFDIHEVDKKLYEDIKSGFSSPFCLTDSKKIVEELQNKGLREINQWSGMVLEKENFKPVSIHEEVFKLNDKTLLNQWFEVVNQESLNSKKLNVNTFNENLESNKFQFWALKKDGVIVSTLLSYIDNDTIGLYFIATLSDHRKKGYASQLISACLENWFKQGGKKAVLHATKYGKKIYERFGFEHQNTISTLWLIGKNYR